MQVHWIAVAREEVKKNYEQNEKRTGSEHSQANQKDHSAVEKLEECTSARRFIEKETNTHRHLSN